MIRLRLSVLPASVCSDSVCLSYLRLSVRMRLSGLPRSSDMPRNKFRVLSKFSLSPFSRRGRLSRGCCTVHCRCAVVVTMFELSKSISVSRLALESGPSNSFPSPLSVSLDIVVSFGSWFATPLGVDLVSAPCSAWPGGNRRRGGVDEPRHRARRGGVGGWDYL